jgi:prolipoprotein diacylglyceryltransferase
VTDVRGAPVLDDVGGSRRSNDGRAETEAERIDRNLGELLQELRVATMGVQVLFGFLLAIPFTTRFADLDDWQQGLFTVDLVLSALAIALLAAPVAHHRLLFRRHAKASILRVANGLAIVGLVTVGLAISGSVLLVVSFVNGALTAWVVTAATAVVVFGLWFAFPLSNHAPDDDY